VGEPAEHLRVAQVQRPHHRIGDEVQVHRCRHPAGQHLRRVGGHPVGHPRHHVVVAAQQDRQEQRVLGAEVQVDGALADPGVPRDVLDRDPLVPPAHEQVGSGVEHPLEPTV